MVIYKFTHLATGRSYVGQTIQDPNQRRLEHIASSKHTPATYHFHNALQKYGIESFKFEVIATTSSIEELNILEEEFILKFDSINNGFNICNGGSNKTHHPESIERMRESQRLAHAKRKANGTNKPSWNKGKSGYTMAGHSDESKQAMSDIMKEKYKDNAYKERVADAIRCSHQTQKFKDKMKIINTKKAIQFKNKTWKLINGKRVWMEKV